MANIRILQRSFAGGEVSPEMFGRIDDAKYQAGLAKCRNFITKVKGRQRIARDLRSCARSRTAPSARA